MRFPLPLLLLLLLLAGCFGSTEAARSHFVLHGITAPQAPGAPFSGLVRVRDLTAANIYEKSQIVIRKNPYELQYSEDNVWAVKPNTMVSDVIARGLAESGRFTSVVRQLGELRPDFILSGDLHAIEIYDSGDIWFAHISLSLSLTRFRTGETLHTFTFDERRKLPTTTFAQGARAISELLSMAVERLIRDMERIDAKRAPASAARPLIPLSESSGDETDEAEKADGEDGDENPDEGADAGDDTDEDTIFVAEPKPAGG